MDDNNKIYGEITGCSDVHVALVTEDSKETYNAETPEFFAPVAEITFDYAESITPRYYDNVEFFMDVDDGETKISVIFSGVPNEIAAKYLGLPYDAEKGVIVETTPHPPWAAVSGKMDIAGGNQMYYQYLKGKFSRGSKKGNTRGGSKTYNTTDLTFTAAKTVHKFQLPDGKIDGIRGVTGATTDEKFTGADAWFDKVQTPDEVAAANEE